MLVSIDWIKDFVNVPEMNPKDLGVKFTLATAEVEDVKIKGTHLKDIRVVEIISLTKHPEADKLNLVTFKLSETETKEVVCGAPNVKVGIKVPYAKIGTTLPNGMTLEPKKIRGILSEGMLCSSVELGLGEDSSGLLVLPETAKIGTDLLTTLNETCDVLLDIDNKSLTHRPDLWGHFGMAREFSTIFRLPLKNRFDEAWASQLKSKFNSQPSPIIPEVEADSAGLAYYALSIDGVKVTESPEWMKRRLLAVGLRPINSIVDISNYVMLELGMPLHIFDRDMISGKKLKISKLKSPTKFLTLDKIERTLVEGDTVISDEKEPLVLAGIMGGLKSGVTESSQNILIEVANWQAAMVRKTSVRLGLRSDSSQRYEKSLDSKLCERTLLRTLELILQLNPNAKVIGKAEYSGQNLNEIPTLVLSTSASRISKKLGKEIPASEIKSIFTYLGFMVEGDSEFKVTIPSYRCTKDISVEDDLIEEIGRIIGFDNILPVSPVGDIKAVRLSYSKMLQRKVQDFLINHAEACELMTYPLTGEKLLKKTEWLTLNDELTLVNPVSVDHDRMRPSLIPSLLETVAENSKNFEEYRCFELGRVYLPDVKNFNSEKSHLIIAFYSRLKNNFIALENVVEKLIRSIGVPYELTDVNEKFPNTIVPHTWKGVHPHEYQNIKIMGQNLGVIFSAHPLILRNFKIKGNLHFAILDISSLESKEIKDKFKYSPLPKFPSSDFDFTVVAETNTAVEKIMSVVKSVRLKEIVSRSVVDIYKINENQKSVTIRITFQDLEQTLSSEFLKSAEEQLIKKLNESGFPLKA
jgi:phenylalanyl-tRNA synthetase beta chain